MNTCDIKDKVCNFDLLYKSMCHCRKGVLWKDSVAGYTKNAFINIHHALDALENNTYQIAPYTLFKVYEPKERDIVSTRFKDRVFQRAFCETYFYDQMTKGFIYDNAACQKGKGNEFARKRLICHLQRHFRKHKLTGYVLKLDLKNFFGSTPHTVAYEAVTDRVPDEWPRKVAKQVIDSFNQGEDPEIGMGLGSEMTQLIQLAVLDKLDHIIKERLRVKYYVRYNDDMILIHEDKDFLIDCLWFIRKWLTSRGLQISEKKTQIFPVKQGIRFLGYRFRLTETGKVVVTVMPEKISHERRKLRKMADRVKQGYMTKEQVDGCYDAWKTCTGNRHRPGTSGRRAHRDTHALILKMDQFYKNLWKEE